MQPKQLKQKENVFDSHNENRVSGTAGSRGSNTAVKSKFHSTFIPLPSIGPIRQILP